jgi:hypothetical protein
MSARENKMKLRTLTLVAAVLIPAASCKIRSNSDLSDVSDGKFRLGKTELVSPVSGERIGYYLSLCPETGAKFSAQDVKEKCINPYEMYDSVSRTHVRALFRVVPPNKQKEIIDAAIAREVTRIQSGMKSREDAMDSKQGELSKGVADAKLKVAMLAELDGEKGTIAVLQTQLDELLPKATDELKIDPQLLAPGATIPSDKFAVATVRVGGDARSSRTFQQQDGSSKITCSCLNSPTVVYLSQGMTSCRDMVEDPSRCRAKAATPPLTEGKRCYCLLRGGTIDAKPENQRLFDPGQGVKCSEAQIDPVDQCFTDSERAAIEKSKGTVDLIKKIQQQKAELARLQDDKTKYTNEISAWDSRRKELVSELSRLNEEYEKLKSQPQDPTIIATNSFANEELELAAKFSDVFDGGWDVSASNVTSVPKLLAVMEKRFNLRLNCRLAEKFSRRDFGELYTNVQIPSCDSRNEAEITVNKNFEEDVARQAAQGVVPQDGLYRHPSLDYVKVVPNGNGGISLQKVEPGPSVIIGDYSDCRGGICSSRPGEIRAVVGFKLAVLGNEEIGIINSEGNLFKFKFSESKLDPGVYRDERKIADLDAEARRVEEARRKAEADKRAADAAKAKAEADKAKAAASSSGSPAAPSSSSPSNVISTDNGLQLQSGTTFDQFGNPVQSQSSGTSTSQPVEKEPYAADFRVTVTRSGQYIIELCGLTSNAQSLIREKFNCKGTSKCVAESNDTRVIDIRSKTSMQLTYGRKVDLKKIGEVGAVSDDCDESKVVKLPPKPQPVDQNGNVQNGSFVNKPAGQATGGSNGSQPRSSNPSSGSLPVISPGRRTQ